MHATGAFDGAFSGVDVHVLVALALPRRVCRETGDAARGQRHRFALIERLAVRRVSRDAQHHGPRGLPGCGKVEVGSDIIPRARLEDDVLDTVGLADDAPADLRLQGRALRKLCESLDCAQHLACPGRALQDILPRRQAFDNLLASRLGLNGKPHQVVEQFLLRTGEDNGCAARLRGFPPAHQPDVLPEIRGKLTQGRDDRHTSCSQRSDDGPRESDGTLAYIT